MKKTIVVAAVFSAIIITSSCSVSDMRKGTELYKVDIAQSVDQIKGRQILNAYVIENGYDKFSSVETYQVKAREHWKGMMGNMGNPWPEKNLSYVMKFVPDLNEFTNQIKLSSEKKNGDVWGMKKTLSSVYYQKKGAERKPIKEGKESFMLANYQWWIEFPYRLNQLENVTFAGVKEKNGEIYDLVLATWGDDLKAKKDFDQYMLWFNQSTGLIDLVTFTYRDVPMMMPPFMYGTALFDDYRVVNGIRMPFSQKFQINGPSEKSKYAHHFMIDNIEFDIFSKEYLLSIKK